jgi:hypothetical protein
MRWFAHALRPSIVSALRNAAAALPPALAYDTDLSASLEEAAERLEGSGVFRVAVVGQFSTGKSRLLNCLLRDEVLEYDVRPETDCITSLQHSGVPRARIITEDGGGDAVALAEVAEETKRVRCRGGTVQIRELFSPHVPRGCCFMDTPGLNSGSIKHDARAGRAANLADLVVYLVDCKGPGAYDVKFIQSHMNERATPVVLVISLADMLRPPGKQREVSKEAHDMLAQQFPDLRLEYLCCLSPLELFDELTRGEPGIWSSAFYGILDTVKQLAAEPGPGCVELKIQVQGHLEKLRSAVEWLGQQAADRDGYEAERKRLAARLDVLQQRRASWQADLAGAAKGFREQISSQLSGLRAGTFGSLHRYMETHSRDHLNSLLESEITDALRRCLSDLKGQWNDLIEHWHNALQQDYDEYGIGLLTFAYQLDPQASLRVEVEKLNIDARLSIYGPLDSIGDLLSSIDRLVVSIPTDLLGGYKKHFHPQIERNLDRNWPELQSAMDSLCEEWEARVCRDGTDWLVTEVKRAEKKLAETERVMQSYAAADALAPAREASRHLERLAAILTAATAYLAHRWADCASVLAQSRDAAPVWACTFLRGCARRHLRNVDGARDDFASVVSDPVAPDAARAAAQINAASLTHVDNFPRLARALAAVRADYPEPVADQLLKVFARRGFWDSVQRELDGGAPPEHVLVRVREMPQERLLLGAYVRDIEGRFEDADRLPSRLAEASPLGAELTSRALYHRDGSVQAWARRLPQLWEKFPELRGSGITRLRWRVGRAKAQQTKGGSASDLAALPPLPLSLANAADGRVIDDIPLT